MNPHFTIQLLIFILFTAGAKAQDVTLGIQADYGNSDFGYSKIKVLDKRVRLLMPRVLLPLEKKRFKQMYGEVDFKKTAGFTSPNAHINFMLREVDMDAQKEDLPKIFLGVAQELAKKNNVELLSSGKVKIGDREGWFIEYIRKAYDPDAQLEVTVYLYQFFSNLSGKLLKGTFHCWGQYLPGWEQKGKQILSSIEYLAP